MKSFSEILDIIKNNPKGCVCKLIQEEHGCKNCRIYEIRPIGFDSGSSLQCHDSNNSFSKDLIKIIELKSRKEKLEKLLK